MRILVNKDEWNAVKNSALTAMSKVSEHEDSIMTLVRKIILLEEKAHQLSNVLQRTLAVIENDQALDKGKESEIDYFDHRITALEKQGKVE